MSVSFGFTLESAVIPMSLPFAIPFGVSCVRDISDVPRFTFIYLAKEGLGTLIEIISGYLSTLGFNTSTSAPALKVFLTKASAAFFSSNSFSFLAFFY